LHLGLSEDVALRVSLEGLTLHVVDVDRSRDFYMRIPGVALEHQRAGEFALLRIGDRWLGLLRGRAPGFHIEVSTSDLDDLYARLRRGGVEPNGPPKERSWGERTFVVVDPDGNLIEFQ
jgi:catechol 2,3-dioxygenase-like lactoylglutathione lyase family enzyme